MHRQAGNQLTQQGATMRKVIFEKAGDYAGSYHNPEYVFLTSGCRSYKLRHTIFHRNDYHSVIRIPVDVFRANFRYEAHSGVYRNLNKITWEELKKIASVETFRLRIN